MSSTFGRLVKGAGGRFKMGLLKLHAYFTPGLPYPRAEFDYASARCNRYGEIAASSPDKLWPSSMVDEGSWFSLSAQLRDVVGSTSGKNTGAVGTPSIILRNTDLTKTIFFDQITISSQTSVDTSTTGVQCYVGLCLNPPSASGFSYNTLGSTSLTGSFPTNSILRALDGVNVAISLAFTPTILRLGPIKQFFNPAATVAVGDTYCIQFGKTNSGSSYTISPETVRYSNVTYPPLLIPPGTCAFIYVWANSRSFSGADANYNVALSWWER